MQTTILRSAKTLTCFGNGRAYSTPRHLMSIADLSPAELSRLVLNAAKYKAAYKVGSFPERLRNSLSGPAVAMMFSKRSTRTRVSTESAVSLMGGTPMFLGKDDIQLGVNESLIDTSRVISSMALCMVARVGPHSDVTGLAEESSVPVINALSAEFHPLQTIADILTIYEAFSKKENNRNSLGLEGKKVAWVGDSNNVLFDLAIGCLKLGIDVAVASPRGYGIPERMRSLILASSNGDSKFSESIEPKDAIANADILVTDTWVSMGQEDETARRLKAFANYRITNELATSGGAKANWKFMHCLPRHPEEVADEVFYGPQSLVFQEAENRLWAAVAALEGFVVNKGHIV